MYNNTNLANNTYDITFFVRHTHTHVHIYDFSYVLYVHVFIYTYECGYVHECVFVDVYFIETEKFEALYIKLLGLFISGRLSCLSLGDYLV